MGRTSYEEVCFQITEEELKLGNKYRDRRGANALPRNRSQGSRACQSLPIAVRCRHQQPQRHPLLTTTTTSRLLGKTVGKGSHGRSEPVSAHTTEVCRAASSVLTYMPRSIDGIFWSAMIRLHQATHGEPQNYSIRWSLLADLNSFCSLG